MSKPRRSPPGGGDRARRPTPHAAFVEELLRDPETRRAYDALDAEAPTAPANPIAGFGATWAKRRAACWTCALPPGPWPTERRPIAALIADAYVHHGQGPKAIFDWLRGPVTDDPRTGAGYRLDHPDMSQRLTWGKLTNHITQHLRPLMRDG